MSHFTVTLPSGIEWTPRFATGVDAGKCIGCGRCFKTCAREVLKLMGIDDDGAYVSIDDDDDGDDYEKKVMTVGNPEHCVGCESCGKVCGKKAISHAPRAV